MGKIEINGTDFAMHPGKKQTNKQKGSRDTECAGQAHKLQRVWGGSEKVQGYMEGDQQRGKIYEAYKIPHAVEED